MSKLENDNRVFIPVTLSKKRRFGRMVLNAFPGMLLAASVFDKRPDTVGALVLGIFCFIAGIAVIYFSVRDYRSQGQHRFMGADSLAVFTGLLLIAQGAQSFDAVRGFQPAHLLFTAALLYIFKGTMFPDKGLKRGFTLTNHDLTFRKSVFRKYGPFPISEIAGVKQQGTNILLVKHDGSAVDLNMNGLNQPEIIFDSLRTELESLITVSPAENRSSSNTGAGARH